jgi:hypothetical protein
MYKILIIALVLFASCTEKTMKKKLLVTFQNSIDYPNNKDYNGTDTSLLLVDGDIIKTWNKYDDQFIIL